MQDFADDIFKDEIERQKKEKYVSLGGGGDDDDDDDDYDDADLDEEADDEEEEVEGLSKGRRRRRINRHIQMHPDYVPPFIDRDLYIKWQAAAEDAENKRRIAQSPDSVDRWGHKLGDPNYGVQPPDTLSINSDTTSSLSDLPENTSVIDQAYLQRLPENLLAASEPLLNPDGKVAYS
mmetsp:Transcript_43659/g.70209  ORF Transcript_43659/g.70209 Transcript_43659/m.70209 type:complete len:178 (-) Transcript_43659:125-658(-)